MNSEEDEGEDDEALTPPLRKPPEPGSLITDDFAAAAGSTEEFPQFDTEDGDTDGKRLLVGQYFAHGRALLQRFPESECAQAALEEFTTRPDPTWLDMVTIMQDAGEEVAGKIFERITDEWIASLPPREPKPEPVVRRRRGKVT
jgi:hypothetical protein